MGVGRLTRLYDGGDCDVEFDAATFSGIPVSALVSAEAEINLHRLDALLEEGKFDEARAYYAEHCREHLKAADLDQRLAEEEARRVARERSHIRAQVERCLEDGDLDSADAMYRAQCGEWWDGVEYGELRSRYVAAHAWVEAYASASLAQLDALYHASLARWMTADDCAQLKVLKLRQRLARLGMPLDDEQLVACSRPERHRLIRARAGSGKTRTLGRIQL